MTICKYNIGDMVEIIDKGAIYPSYTEWANKYGFTNFTHYVSRNGVIGTIFVKAAHSRYSSRLLYGVRLNSSTKEIIIGQYGIKKHMKAILPKNIRKNIKELQLK